MNAKTEQQIQRMKQQTIGVEIEMNNITRERAARLAAAYFGTGRCEYTASRNGYSTCRHGMHRAENGSFNGTTPSPA